MSGEGYWPRRKSFCKSSASNTRFCTASNPTRAISGSTARDLEHVRVPDVLQHRDAAVGDAGLRRQLAARAGEWSADSLVRRRWPAGPICRRSCTTPISTSPGILTATIGSAASLVSARAYTATSIIVDSDSLRLMGRAAGVVAVSPNMDIVLGAVYLDRVDIKILPVAGVYYRPTPDWDMYMVFPNPKIRKFLAAVGTTKWYGYGAGEYGGGSWTVARQTTDDRIDYNDIRVIGGLEWETQTQIRGHIELGYVFDREIIFVSGDPPNFKPDDTIMLRAGVDF